MLDTVKELQDLIYNDPTYDGCAIDLPQRKVHCYSLWWVAAAPVPKP